MQIITGESIAAAVTYWGCPCEFIKLENAPQIINYYFKLNNILQLKKIKKLCDDKILEAWGNSVFNFSPYFGGFCLQMNKKERETIHNNYTKQLKEPGDLIIGIDGNNQPIIKNITDLTHLLVAGTTGSGKSVVLHNFIVSLLAKNIIDTPLVYIIDPKRMEFNIYKNHVTVINEITQTKILLAKLIAEMERRNKQLEKMGKQKNAGEFKKIVVIIDELADIILQDETIKPLLVRLLQKARASGIHFIIATQSPRAKILDGVTLANLPSCLALTCASSRESVLILGHGGAEKLMGKGDAIFKAQDTTQEIRVQAPFTDLTKIRFNNNETINTTTKTKPKTTFWQSIKNIFKRKTKETENNEPYSIEEQNFYDCIDDE